MFKAFATAAIISCTSALGTQVKDIYGNPFNHPDEEVKTPTCTLKVHSVLPDLDVPKVPIKTLTKRTGYDPYGIHDDFDPDLDDYYGTSTGGDTMTSDDMTSDDMTSDDMTSGDMASGDMTSSDMMTSDDMMTSADMMSDMMSGMDMMESSDMMSEMMSGM